MLASGWQHAAAHAPACRRCSAAAEGKAAPSGIRSLQEEGAAEKEAAGEAKLSTYALRIKVGVPACIAGAAKGGLRCCSCSGCRVRCCCCPCALRVEARTFVDGMASKRRRRLRCCLGSRRSMRSCWCCGCWLHRSCSQPVATSPEVWAPPPPLFTRPRRPACQRAKLSLPCRHLPLAAEPRGPRCLHCRSDRAQGGRQAGRRRQQGCLSSHKAQFSWGHLGCRLLFGMAAVI